MTGPGRHWHQQQAGYPAPRPQPLKALRRALREFRDEWFRPAVFAALAGVMAFDAVMWLWWQR